ncbi:hypothetical protein RJ639_031428 [Escallonia herrerae]|uniref:Mitochondrial dicarboxylate carrier n=1 Tax=Escallonia herrerae TaxID=1293975 RepID=A0AA88X2F6_9ASTE|nr:hypothetical protein RJ639_031428 [Escallonia herrerae]
MSMLKSLHHRIRNMTSIWNIKIYFFFESRDFFDRIVLVRRDFFESSDFFHQILLVQSPIPRDNSRESWDSRRLWPFARKFAGLIASGIGAAVGNPTDVAMVRMQADGRLPASQRRNYKGVVDAITRMSRQEGVASLWHGSSLTVNRAMIVTASQLASYDQIKETILENRVMRNGLETHVTASFAAGFMATVASNSIDVIKTRVMNMKVEPGVAPLYSGTLDCALKTMRSEGPLALYKGFIPTISMQGPFTVVLFVTLEQVRKLMKDFKFSLPYGEDDDDENL